MTIAIFSVRDIQLGTIGYGGHGHQDSFEPEMSKFIGKRYKFMLRESVGDGTKWWSISEDDEQRHIVSEHRWIFHRDWLATDEECFGLGDKVELETKPIAWHRYKSLKIKKKT